MNTKKKLLFTVDNLAMGGVTKVLVNLLNRFDYEKYQVDLLVLHHQEDMQITLHPQVKLICGGELYRYIDCSLGSILRSKDPMALLGKLKTVFLLKTGLIRHAIRRDRKKLLHSAYDTEIAFNDGFTEIFVACGDTPRKLAWMHCDLFVHNDSARYQKLIRRSLCAMDMCVGVSEQVAQSYQSCYGLSRFCVIHNIINADEILEKAALPCSLPYREDEISLVSVGRLCDQKYYTRFVRVHRRLCDDGYRVHSYIVGEGADRENLEKEIAKLGIGDSFTLLGRKDNPFPYVKHADLFVLSSIYEGLPTVLYEAVILSIPCVTTAVAGADEILQGKYGLVTENSDDGLYCGIKEMLDTDLASRCRAHLDDYRFDTAAIMQQVENIL